MSRGDSLSEFPIAELLLNPEWLRIVMAADTGIRSEWWGGVTVGIEVKVLILWLWNAESGRETRCG